MFPKSALRPAFSLPVPASRRRPITGLLALLAFCGSAAAATLTWDGNGATAPNPDGGNGTWDVNTAFNWWDGAANVVWPVLGGTDDDAVFGNNAGTVSLAAGGITANDLTFNTTGYLIQNNTLTLNGTTPTITTAPGVTATISSVIAGGAGLTKAGNGTLILTGANTYTGGTIISGGILQLGDGITQPTIHSTYAIGSGATLKVQYNGSGSSAQTWSKYTGAGTLAFTTGKNFDYGLDSATLGAGFTGTLRIEGGRIYLLAATGAATKYGLGGATKVAIQPGGHLGLWDNGITLPATTTFDIAGTGYGEAGYEAAIRMANAGATSTIEGTVNLTASAAIGAGGTGVISGQITGGGSSELSIGTSSMAGTIILSADNTYSGATAVKTGTLRLGNGGTTGSLNTASTITLYGGTLAFNRSDNISQGTQFSASPITGAGALSQMGPGILTLNATNTYSGGTTITAGTIRQGVANALPVGRALTVNGTSVFDLNGYNSSISTLGGAATGIVTDNSGSDGTSTLAVTAAAGDISVKVMDGASRAVALRVTNDNGVFRLATGGSTFSGGITLTHSGSGTRMSPGTIAAGAYGTGPITVGEAATDKAGIYFANASQTLANPIISNTGLGTDRVGTFRVDGTGIVLSGQLTANLAPMTFSTNGTGGVTATNKITGSNGLTLLSHALGGTALTVTLNNAAGTNDYAGDTIINQNPEAGRSYTLALGAANQIPNGAGKGNVIINTNGTGVGTLSLAGFSETINGLSGNGTVDGALTGTPTNTLTVGDNNATALFSGTIKSTAGALSLNKIGAGTQTLSGANTFSGGTTVSAGTLNAIGSSSLGTNSGLTIAGSATLNYLPTASGPLSLGTGVLNFASGSRIGTALGGTLGQSAIVSSGAAVTVAGPVTVDIYSIPGVAAAVGSHNLITAAGGGLNTATYALGNVYNATNFTVSGLSQSGTAVSITTAAATALATEYWKGGLSGAPGVWAASNGSTASNWASDLAGTATSLTPGSTATVIFSATGATDQSAMTLGANMSVGGIVVNDTTASMALNADGNTLTVGAGGISLNPGAGAFTINTPVTLSGAQSWTNDSGGNTLTMGGAVANAGLLLTVAGTGNTTISGVLSGSGGLTKTGTGTLTLGASPTYTGLTTLTGGTIVLNASNDLVNTTVDVNGGVVNFGSLTAASFGGLQGTQNLSLLNGSSSPVTLTVGANNGTTSYAGVLSGAGGSLVKAGTGNLTLTGANSYDGTTTVTRGILFLGGASSTVLGNVVMNGPDGTYIRMQQSNQFGSGVVGNFNSASGSWNRFELFGKNQTLAGISTGTATTQGGGVIQNSETNGAAGGVATLTLNGAGNYIFNGHLRDYGSPAAGTHPLSLSKTGGGTQTLIGTVISYSGATTVSNGTLKLSNTTVFKSPIANSAVVEFEATSGGATSAALSGAGTYNKTGSGIFQVNGGQAITTTGQFNIQQGTLQNNNNAVNWTGNKADIDVSSGAILDLYADPIFLDVLTGTGIVQNNFGNTLGNQSGSAAFIEKLVLGTNDGSGSFGGVIRGNVTNAPLAAGAGLGGLQLEKVGTGTQGLTGTNLYTGSTTVNGGILQLDFAAGGTSNIIAPTSALVLGGGTLEIKGGSGETNTQTINGVSGLGRLLLTPNGATSINATLGAVSTTGGMINFAGSDATVGALGTMNFLTSTTTAGNDGTTRLGAHLWNGASWASTSSSGGNHVVQWVGTYTDLTTDGNSAANPNGDLRIIDGAAAGTAATYSADTTANSLLAVAPTYASTLDLGTTTLTLGNGAGATGVIGLGTSSQALTIGATAGQGFLSAGTTAAASTLALNNQSASALTINSVIKDNAAGGVVSLATSGSATLNAVNTFTGSTTVNLGTLTIGGAGTLGTGAYAGAVSIANGGTFAYASSAPQTLSGVISGAGTLVVNGSGTLTVSGVNTFTGTTTINAGVLNIQNANALGSTAAGTTVVSNAALQIQGGITTAAEPLTLNGTGVAADGALRNISGTNTFAGPITLGSATRINSDAGTLNLTANVGGAGQNLTVGGAGNTSITGVIGITTGSLTKDGAGTLTLNTSRSTYTGGTIVNNGTLNLALAGGGATILSGSVTINSPGTVTATAANVFGWTNAFTGLNINGGTFDSSTIQQHFFNDNAGVLSINMTGGTLTLGGPATTSGNQIKNAPITVIASSNQAVINGTGWFNIRDGSNQSFNVGDGSQAVDLLVSLPVTQNGAGGSITKSGAGTMALSAANAYTGATNVTGGTLSLTGANGSILTSAPTISGGATLRLDNTGAANSASRLGDALAVSLNSGTLQFSNDAAAATNFSETTGTLNILGGTNTIAASQADIGQTSMLTFAGLNYTSGTVDFSGTGLGVDTRNRVLVTSYVNGFLMPWATINGSGMAKYSSTLGVTLAAFTDVPFAGTIADGPSTDIRLSGGTYTGTSADNVLLGSATTTVGNVLQAQTNPTTIDNASKVLRLGAAGGIVLPSGLASLTIGTAANSGTLTAGGADNTAGTVNLTNSDATALLTVNSVIANNGSGAVGVATAGAGKVVLAGANTYTGTTVLGAATTEFSGGNQTLAGAISGSGTLLKSGAGTLTLGTGNSYTGATNVSQGTLKLGNAGALGTSSAVTVAGGATLDVAGFSIARPLTISGTGVSGSALLNSSTSAGSTISSLTLGADASVGNGSTDRSFTLGITTLNLAGKKLTISTGAVAIGATSLPSGNIDINSGGTLVVEGSSTAAVTGTITVNNGGRFETRDTSTTGSATTHDIYLNGGALSRAVITNNNGGGAGTILKNNITVDATNGGAITNNSGFTNYYRLTGALSGSGALTLNGTNPNGVEFQGDTSGYTGTATTSGSGTVSFNSTAAIQTFGGILAGTQPVVKSGSNTTVFAGNNTYSGATTVSGGTLILNGANTSSTSAFTVNAGALLKLDYATNNNRKIGSGVLTLSGGTIELAGLGGTFADSVASTTLTASTASTITQSSGAATLNLGAITRNTASFLNFGQSGIARTTNANNANGILGSWATIGGSQFAINDGSGLIVAATSTDLTRLSSGSKLIPDGAAGHIRLIEGTGTTGNFTLGAAATTVNTLTQSSVGGTSAATVDMAGQTLALNTVMVGTGAGALTIGTAVNNGTLKAAGTALEFRDLAAAGVTVNSVIADGTGATTLTKTDAGILTFAGTNIYTGGTVVNAGTLTASLGTTAGARTPFGTGAITANSGTTLRFFAASTANAMSFGNAINLNAATLTSEDANQTYSGNIALTGANTVNVTYSDKSATFSGVVSGGGSLTKASAGLLTLSGANTYTGGTTLSAGILKTANTAALGAAAAALTLNGGTLQLATDSALSSKNVTVGGSSTITLDRASSGTGIATSFGSLSFGNNLTLTVNKGANVLSGISTLNFTGFPALGAAGTTTGFNIGADAEVNISGSLTGTQAFANISKSGAGRLILSGNNNYWDPTSGLVTVSAGTLDLRSQNAMGDGTTGTNSIALSMAASTTLRLGTNASLGNYADLTLTGSGVTIISDRDTGGAGITNQFDVLSIGAHTLNVTGGSNVTSGTTQVNFNSATLTGNAVFNVVNPTAGSTNMLVSGVMGGNTFSLTKSGSGTLTLQGANTINSTVAVTGGTLNLSGANGAIASTTGITLSNGGILTLANTSAANNGNRIAGTFAMNGGTLNFSNDTASGSYAETTGNLSVGGGTNIISSTRAASAATSTLAFGALSRTAGTLNFSGTGLGLDARNRITFSGGVTAGQLIGTWATYNGTDFAGYDATNGVVALTAYTDVTRLASGTKVIANTAANNVRIIEGTGAPASITLAAATTTINTLNQSISGGASAATIDPGTTETLAVNSILVASGAGGLSIGTTAGDGTLKSAGTSLLVIENSSGGSTINSTIANGTATSSFTKSGSGLLTLTGTNTYTGVTAIEGGILAVSVMANGGSNSGIGAAPVAAANLVLNNGSLRYTGNTVASNRGFTIAAESTGTVDVSTAAQTLTISGGIAATTGSLVKAGAGNLTLSAASAHSGTTSVTGGKLTVSSTMLNSSAFSVGTGATLEFGATNIFVSGHGTALADSRVITADGGTLLFNSGADFRFGNVTLSNGATWTSDRVLTNYDALLANTVSGAATVRVTGTGASTMNGTGGIHLQGVQNFDVADVTASSATDLTVSMILAAQGTAGGAEGGINKLGAGTMVLSGINTYTGLTNVAAGTLALSGGAAIADTSAVNLENTAGAVLLLNNSESIRSLAGGGATGGNVSLGANTLTVGALNDSTTYAGVISGALGGLTKQGSGTMVLNGANTYTGATTISGGTLKVSRSVVANDFIASSGYAVSSGATVELNYTGVTGSRFSNVNNTVTGAGTFAKTGDGFIWLANDSGAKYTTFDMASGGHLDIQGGTLDSLKTSAGNKADLTIASGATLSNPKSAIYFDALNGGGTLGLDTFTVTFGADNGGGTFSGSISGTGGVTKTGSGTQILSGANTYSGTTTVSAGTLRLNRGTADNSAIPTDANTATTSDILINGGTLEIAATEQIGNTGSITMSSGALTFSGSGRTETIDRFTNSGGVFTTGANTLIGLGNTVTWSGGTNTVSNGGSVQDAHIVISGGTNTVEGGAMGGVLQLNSGGTGLEMSNGSLLTLNSDAAVAGKLVLKGNVSTSGDSTVTIASGLANANAGTIDLDGGTRSFTVANGAAASDLTVSAVITNGSVTKAGAGTMTLSGANTYTGTTSITGGTLLMGASNVFHDSSDLNLGDGATGGILATGGNSDTVDVVALLSDSVIDMGSGSGSSLTFASNGSWSGTLQVWNWSGSIWSVGTDHLVFTANTLSSGNLSSIQFYSGAGSGPIGAGAGFIGNELVPVPEPGAAVAAALLLGAIGWRGRRSAARRRGMENAETLKC